MTTYTVQATTPVPHTAVFLDPDEAITYLVAHTSDEDRESGRGGIHATGSKLRPATEPIHMEARWRTSLRS